MTVNYLSNRHAFCGLMNEARLYGVRGAWSGSAFRDHPCGIIRANIKMTNDWHVSDSCSICITDGDGWNVSDICRESCAHGNPRPQPINGHSISAWSSGHWVSEDMRLALELIVVKILEEAADHVARAKNWEIAIKAHDTHTKHIVHQLAISLALQKAAIAA